MTPNSLYEQQTAYYSYRFPTPNNVSLCGRGSQIMNMKQMGLVGLGR